MPTHQEVIETLKAENARLRAQLAEAQASRERLRHLVLASELILRHPARYDVNPPPLEMLTRFSAALKALEPGDREPMPTELAGEAP